MEEAGVKVEKGNYLPYAFTISNLNYLGKIAAFRQGKFAVQDESSQLAVAIADINEGDFVLDVCAAPGGKTFHAADRLICSLLRISLIHQGCYDRCIE